jgi:NAD(P)-dependent dehydrogenase (short-subunit alcohol dehydrogenase family)
MARTLARILHGNVDIILVGRNGDAAAAVLASLTAPTSSGPGLGGDKDKPIRAFVRCDATLMRDVARAAAEIRALVQRVNFVVVSQAVLDFAAREETDEGIDRKSALFYYSRWKFIYEYVVPAGGERMYSLCLQAYAAHASRRRPEADRQRHERSPSRRRRQG